MTTTSPYVPLINGTGTLVVHGEVVRVSSTDTFVRAQADSSTHLAGLIGINGSGSIGPGGSANIFTSGALVDLLLDNGLTPVAGQTVYVSALTPGRGTNVAPVMASALGVIESAVAYASTKIVQIALSLSTGAGGGGGSGTVVVANTTALAALDASGYGAGQRVYVQTLKTSFELIVSGDATLAYVRIAALNQPTMLWFRDTVSPAWWPQGTWNVDPAAGNDENDGLVLPLKTFAEWNRRTNFSTENVAYFITLLSDAPDSDWFEVTTQPAAKSDACYAAIFGTVTAIPVGVIASSVARDPTTNTGNQITVTGFNWAPYVGKLLQLHGNPAITAVIEKDLGAGQCRLGQGYFTASDFTTGQTVEVCSTTKVPGIAVANANVIGAILNCTVGSVAGGLFAQSPGNVIFDQCEIRLGAGGNAIASQGVSFNGCAFNGQNYNLWGCISLDYCSFVNCPTVHLFGTGTAAQSQNRCHMINAGSQNSSLYVDDNNILRMSGDFHCFDLAANRFGIGLRFAAICYSAEYYYGSGNNVLSAGYAMLPMSQVYYVPGFIPSMDAGLGAWVDIQDFILPSAFGRSVAWVSLPYPSVGGVDNAGCALKPQDASTQGVSGIVKQTSGLLGIAVAPTDYVSTVLSTVHVGAAAAGPIAFAGAAVGAVVVAVLTIAGGIFVDSKSLFESTISVVNQIQQTSGSNLSGNTYFFLIRG